jgi:hypothetical protein
VGVTIGKKSGLSRLANLIYVVRNVHMNSDTREIIEEIVKLMTRILSNGGKEKDKYANEIENENRGWLQNNAENKDIDWKELRAYVRRLVMKNE